MKDYDWVKGEIIHAFVSALTYLTNQEVNGNRFVFASLFNILK